MTRHAVNIQRSTFADGLARLLKSVPSQSKGTFAIELRDGLLLVRTAGGEVNAPASGTWPGVATMPINALRLIAESLPDTPFVVIEVEDSRLRVGGMTFTPQWVSSGGERIEIPLGMPLHEILRLSSNADEAVIDRSGVREAVNIAWREFNDRVDEAAAALHDLGIDRESLLRLATNGVRNAPHGHFAEMNPWIEQVAKAWLQLAPLGVKAEAIVALIDKRLAEMGHPTVGPAGRIGPGKSEGKE